MAERSIIDTMARDLWLEDARRWLKGERDLGRIPADGKDIDPAWYDRDADMPLTGPGFRRQWEGQARAALRSLIDAGPTEAMVVEGNKLVLNADIFRVEEVFAAMLRAALEEADNHG